MTTLFDLLNTIHNNNNNNIYGGACKRTTPTSQYGSNTATTNNNKSSCNNRKIISIIPELDVTLTDEHLIIQVELAGVNKHDIEIDINDSILTIQGEKKKPANNEIKTTTIEKDNIKDDDNEPSIEEFEVDVKQQQPKQTKQTTTPTTQPTTSSTPTPLKSTKYIQERTFGYFKRHLDLTKLLHQLNLNSINTTFENGLLSIVIDKKENYLNSIKIQIN